MKKTIICILAITAALSGFAQSENTTKKITTLKAASSLIINGDISVVLLNDDSKEISIEGGAGTVKSFVVTEHNGTVTISNYSGAKRTDALVYVPAALLKTISINGAAAISSYEPLYNKNIDVVINGDCNLWLKTFGSVSVDALNEFDYTYTAKAIKE